MADEGPPKPKPGSLKDRIKQFEVSSSSSSSGPTPPPLRPKPGTLGQWKPKPLDPPSPNKQTSFSPSSQEASQTSEDHAHASGMSATDAMSSITKGGGSLKERMAALQGKGAFGDTSSSAAPPLTSNEGKPRVWRVSPAPPVEPKKVEESTERSGDKAEDISQERSPIERSPMSPNDEAKAMLTVPDEGAGAGTSEGGEDEEKTEEEQERERRAAIAARMARLGGARVGMPVGFGIAAKGLHGGAKPAIPAKPRLVTPGDTGSAGSSAPASAMSPAPLSSTDETEKPKAVRQSTLDTALKVPLPKSEGSLLTPGLMDEADLPSESDATTTGKLVPPRSPAIPKSPDSMPIPALPKRAAGPRRKKSAKELKPASDSTGDVETPPVPLSDATQESKEPQVTTPTQEEAPPAVEETKPMLSPEPDQPSLDLTDPGNSIDDLVSAAPSEIATPPPPSPSVMATEDEDEESVGEGPYRRPTIELSTREEKIVEEEGSQLLTPRPRSDSSEQMGGASLSTALGGMMLNSELDADEEDLGEVVEDDAEEEEAARKRRVAEKMARLGAVNPFAPGGFTSPISPHSDKQGQAVAKKEEDNADKKSVEDSGQATVTQNTADNDSDVDLAAHESEPNVPVLSQSHSRLSQDAQNEENDPAAKVHLPADSGTGGQDALDDDVDYPMMSPVTGGNHEKSTPYALPDMGDEAVSHKAAAVESSTQYNDERADYSEDDDERATIHDRKAIEEEDLPPKRVTRTVPPPPRSPEVDSSLPQGPSSPSSPTHSPTAYEFDDSSPRAALAAALARRAPRPPPDHQSSVSPPTHSISPTPSPPPRQFIREGAPSPPSLKASSNIDEEEETYDEDEVEYVDDELSEGVDEAQETPTEEHDEVPPIEERERTPSPPPLPKTSPPPLPGGRPPVPNVRRSIPPPPRHALPATPHAEASSRPPLPIPKQSVMLVPSSPSDGGEREVNYLADADDEETRTMQQATGRPALPPPRQNKLTPEYASRTKGIQEKEVMDDEEGDPVDPDFVRSHHSPPDSGIAATRKRENTAPEVQENEEDSPPAADPEVDAEAARRRTIAERMAKLGGIKFGMPVAARPSPVRKHSESREEIEAAENSQSPDAEGDSNQSPEEAERSRRAGIAARMAAMGGRGFGMYGAGAAPAPAAPVSAKTVATALPTHAPNASLGSPTPPPLPGSRPKRQSRDDVAHAINRPPPPAPANNVENSAHGGETSESEVEMINPETEEEGEMVEEVEDEEPELVETPPAPPNRSGRPPVPAASRPPPPPPSSEMASPPLPAGRPTYPPPSLQSDYEVVNEDLRTSSTVPRVSHSRSVPPPITESAVQPSMESSGQWELPNIPSGSFDLGSYGKGHGAPAGTSTTENDASWTKVEQEESGTRAKASTSNQPPSDPFLGPAPSPVSTEALASLAQRMGPAIASSAQHIHEKSKKAVIGDGSSASFLLTVLSSVGGASTTSFGHLVYAQTGGAVQRRLGDIMPGDIVALYDARFKGHKGGLGLGAYSVSWGTKEEPVLGIVTEFEGKKSKIKAFAVNQHPNSYPTIDTPSYKLDDLKAGTLKVFRVAENS